MPICPKLKHTIDNTDLPSKPSDNTIEQSSHSVSLFPLISYQSKFTLKPAMFSPQTLTIPSDPSESIPSKVLLPASVPPLIHKPQVIPLATSLPVQISLLVPPQPAPTLNHLSIPHTTLPPQLSLLTNSASMLTTNKGIRAIPGPGLNKVPLFNGEMSELLEFFELFKELALSCVLTDKQKCKAIVRYTNTLTK